MKRARAQLFCIHFITLCSVLYGQEDQSVFERITLEQGLSQSSVFSIAQDQQGFLWFATQEGLNRYDGYNFKIYRHTSSDSFSLSDNYINTVFVDHRGVLWAGTQFGGLNEYESSGGRFTHFRYSKNDSCSISSNYILHVYEDRRNTMWIGTVNGLNEFHQTTKTFSRYYIDPRQDDKSGENIVRAMYEDRAGQLWIGAYGSIMTFDREKKIFTRYDTDISVTSVNGFEEDTLGRLWCAAAEGLFYLTNKKWIHENALSSRSQLLEGESFLKDANNNFWIGTKNGLIRFNPYTKKNTRFTYNSLDRRSLSGNTALSLFEDRTRIIWIGTYDGISKYASRQTRFRRVAIAPGKIKNGGWNKIRSFAEDPSGMIWVATQEGMMKYDRITNQLTQMEGKNAFRNRGGTNTIWVLEKENQAAISGLWLGSNGNGLIHMKISSDENISYEYFCYQKKIPSSISGNTIWSIHTMHSGEMFIGTLLDGLNRFDRKKQSFTHYQFQPNNPNSIADNTVWSLCEDHAGTLWVGTAGGGLNKFIPEKNNFVRFRHDANNPNSISDDKITSIIEDKSGILWLGTYGGLNRFDPKSETFTVYTMKDGLPNEVIYSVLEDNTGDLWISTNKGLSRFDVHAGIFRNYDIGDGLQSNEFNMGAALKLHSGELLFGGINGFNIFRPERIVNNSYVPPVVLTEITVNSVPLMDGKKMKFVNKEISELDTLELSYSDAVFSFSFASLDYTNPSKNCYAYMLEGFDAQWLQAGTKREATYTNIGPGEYIFRVKGSNNDGIWNEKGAALVVIITPPWWGTWWFRGILVIGFLSIGPFIYFRRVSALKKKNLLQQEFSRQLIQSQEQERQRIAAELHDSVGQDLLIIKNKLLFESETEVKSSGVKDVIEYISTSLKNVREISRNLRPIQLDQLGLTAALESMLETIAESSRMNFTIRIVDINNTLTKENEINLFRIVQECLNNILKHSGATDVVVEIKKENKILSVIIHDNGIGINLSNEPQRGFGMSSMKERAHILRGELHIDSRQGEGTKIRLTVPI